MIPSTKASKGRKPRGKPFQPGNKEGKGRPPGSLNKTTLALRELFNRDGVAIAEKILAMAKKGDSMAQRIVMDRIFPARRGAPAPWSMPAFKTSAGATAAYLSLLDAVTKGELTPSEGMDYIPLLDKARRVLERDANMRWDQKSLEAFRFLLGYNDDVTLERMLERNRELVKEVEERIESEVGRRVAVGEQSEPQQHPEPSAASGSPEPNILDSAS